MTKHSLTIAVPVYGAPSQTWVYRQSAFLTRFEPLLMYWKRDPECQIIGNDPAIDVGDMAKPIRRTDAGRWLHRSTKLWGRNFYGADGRSSRNITAALKSHGTEVILAHFGQTALYLLPVAERMGVPVVAHFHGHDLSESFVNNRWYRWSLLTNLRRFAACVVVGAHQRERLLKCGGLQDKIHLLPCGVPTERFVPGAKKDEDAFRFVSIARLLRTKGVDISLQAFAQVARRFPNAQFDIIGTGPEQERLVAQAESLSVAGQVRFLGILNEEQVLDTLQRGHALVQHSLESNGVVEGFGVSVAEAASSGLPVVVSRSGGLVDQVIDRETGFVVPIGSVEDMADAMMRLCSDRGMAARMGQAGRRHMVANFDTRGQTAKLERVLEEVSP